MNILIISADDFAHLCVSTSKTLRNHLFLSSLVPEDGSAGLNCCPGGRFPPLTDLDLVECFPIPVPAGDRAFAPAECINFPRSMTAPRLDCLPGPSEQVIKYVAVAAAAVVVLVILAAVL